MPPLHVDVGGGAVDLGEGRAALAAAVGSEVLNRAALQLGNRAALGDTQQDFTSARAVHLRQHEEGLALEPWRFGAGQQPLDQRDRFFGIAVDQSVERQNLQLFVGLRIGPHWLPGGPSHFDLERPGLLEVAAARITFGQFGDRRERVGALSEPVLRVGLPVERRVGARTLQIGQAREVIDRAIPTAFVQRVVALFVERRLAVALGLRPLQVALPLFALTVAALGVAILVEPWTCAHHHWSHRGHHRGWPDRHRSNRAGPDRHRTDGAGPDRANTHRARSHRARSYGAWTNRTRTDGADAERHRRQGSHGCNDRPSGGDVTLNAITDASRHASGNLRSGRRGDRRADPRANNEENRQCLLHMRVP